MDIAVHHLTRRLIAASTCTLLAFAVAADWTPRFSASLDDYAEDEVLSAKGTVGGSWAIATNVLDDAGHRAISVAGEAAFNVTAEAAGDLERVDFSTRVELLEIGAPPAPNGHAGFTASRNRTGTRCPPPVGSRA